MEAFWKRMCADRRSGPVRVLLPSGLTSWFQSGQCGPLEPEIKDLAFDDGLGCPSSDVRVPATVAVGSLQAVAALRPAHKGDPNRPDEAATLHQGYTDREAHRPSSGGCVDGARRTRARLHG